jgi:hypothetical protein
VPAILKNWPRPNKHVLIQQDNATPHITPAEFRVLWLERKVELQNMHGGGLDWDLHLYFQPANSPDTNINDLDFFVSIQALHFQHPIANIGELIARDLQLYQTHPHAKLNMAFASNSSTSFCFLRCFLQCFLSHCVLIVCGSHTRCC